MSEPSDEGPISAVHNLNNVQIAMDTTSVSFGDHNKGFQAGAINGTVNFTSAQSEIRPEPLSTVPLAHDPDFVSRDVLLDQIREKSSVSGSNIALVGLGGVGKTRLAVEYCYQIRQNSPDTWVFWVHASSTARFEESIRDIANRVKIPGRKDRDTNICQLFGNWLRDEKIGEWILVLDNVDDDELLRSPSATGTDEEKETQAGTNSRSHTSSQPPLRYLLGGSNGAIIITSRNKGVALNITGHTRNLIDVQPMNLDEAVSLVQKKLEIGNDDHERDELVALVEELEFMPLAIMQAISYISHRSPRCSVKQYLEKLQQSDKRAIKLLDYEDEGLHTHRDWEARNSIIRTWQISFDHIRRVRQSAADLLALMSFFDRQGIPSNLLKVEGIEDYFEDECSSESASNSSGDESPDTSSESDIESDVEDDIEVDSEVDSDDDSKDNSEDDIDEELDRDITVLIDYSFISLHGNTSTSFTMHRLVQLTVRMWLKTNGQDERWKEISIQNLNAMFPEGEYEDWDTCRSLFPHVKAAALHQPKSGDGLLRLAALLQSSSWFALKCGDILGAQEMAIISRNQRLKVLGAEAEDTMISTRILAEAYQVGGKWEEAEQLGVQLVEMTKAKLGDDHDYTLQNKTSLAIIYMEQQRWEEAEQLVMQVFEADKLNFGTDHSNTLTNLSALALIYRAQGLWEKAGRVQGKVLETRIANFGADHPDTLESMSILASIYRDQGRWEESQQLQTQIIRMMRREPGFDHPDTLFEMANLASSYWDQGMWKEAEQLEVQVLEARKTKLGVDHPDTLSSMFNLAHTLWSSSQETAALLLMTECVQLRGRKLGPDHPDTIKSRHYLEEWRGDDVSSVSADESSPVNEYPDESEELAETLQSTL